MQKTKTFLALAALAVIAAALATAAVIQFATAQPQTAYNSAPQQTANIYAQIPTTHGYAASQTPYQNGYSYGFGRGMCGGYW